MPSRPLAKVVACLSLVALVGPPLVARGAAAPPTEAAAEPALPERTLVFGAEENRLRAFDAATGEGQVVIPSHADDPVGGRDINAQVCFTELDGTHYFIAGEDTGQSGEGEPGWGFFELHGEEIGELSATQQAKLVPTWSGSSSNPENYGCGFLDDGRLLTSDVGDQLPHEEASGQLIVWFPDAGGGFTDDPDDVSEDTNYCKVDTTLGTAGGVWVDGGWVYVASNRPGPGAPGGVYRYPVEGLPVSRSGDTCRLPDGSDYRYDADATSEGLVDRELWLPNDAFVLTPSALVPSGRTWNGFPTWYVSSVFTGVVAEYADTGLARVHVRNVVEPPGGLPVGQADDLPGNDAGTPFGVGVTPEGDLWYADLGIQGSGPVAGHGSFQRVRFDADGEPVRHVVLDGLTYPDGIGIVTFPGDADRGRGAPWPTTTRGSSESTCDDWRMYGGGAARTFAVPDACRSPIDAGTAATLVPKWFFKTPKTVTASPAVADGRVFVGDWSGRFFALDAETGEELWHFDVEPAPGATFGPIVSSAAAATVTGRFGRSGPPSSREVVIFGAGPRVYALEQATGAVVWEHVLDPRPETPVEVESSPVVVGGVVLVGMDNHNTGGTGVRGGLLALDAADGSRLWTFEPELDHGDAGCGGVWSSPTVDVEAELVYVGTANCPDDDFEWTPHTEAITALALRTGEPRWSFQPHPPNDKDHDFGATPNLFRDADGRLLLGAGNKDGVYYALDPATGALHWSQKVADPGDVSDGFSIGGFLGSPAAHRGRVFGATAIGGPPYYHAVDGTDGSLAWRGLQGPSYAASAAVNDVVFTAGLDDVFRAYHADTGAVLWAQPLSGPGSSGPAVVDATVFVGAGTSSSDACAKDTPIFGDACFLLFDEALGATGGVHAFELAG